MKYSVRYGKKTLSVEVDKKRVKGVLAPKKVKPVADVSAAVKRALRRPTGTPPLAKMLEGNKTALIITVDHTRPSPKSLILPVIDLCERQGVAPTVIIATGCHRQMTAAELRSHLGRDILRRARILQHDPFDSRGMVTRGKTRRGTAIRVSREVFRHDVIIGAGIIEPSYLAGYSGGRKLLMPGLAHHESVDNNHFYLTHPDTEIGRLKGNPVSDDAAEFARKLPLDFIVYEISGPNDEVAGVVAGHAVKAHEKACSRSASIYGVKRLEADIVVSTAGGAPYDCDLVQGKKAIIPAIHTVKRNGVIVLCAECPGGLGAEETFIRWLKTKTPLEVTRDVRDRKQFNLGAHGANILAKPIVEKNARVVLVTSPKIARQLQGTYVITATSLPDAWKLANRIAGAKSSVLFIENARRLIVT